MRTVLAVPKMVVENLRSSVYACYEELSAQVQADTALDTKLFGLLSFFAVAGSLLFTLPHGLRSGRTLLLVGVGLGALACLVGSMGGSSPNMGPPPEEFYADFGARAEADYLTQLLADLAATTQLNRQGLELRRRALAIAVGTPVLLAVAYGLVSVT
ncbi:MAG TPA: hypothetical protein VGX72_02515 [Solirubrobacteraceae bacterium]|jgi:hypothetical protein|nr:hypothetical protein [Solirubrobacteraceae bacterium]